MPLQLYSDFRRFILPAVLFGGLLKVNGTPEGSAYGDVLYLDNNGRHFDIWLPAEYCGFLNGAAGSGGWYGFGWGDRDFFLNTPYAADVNPGILLKALFIPSRPVSGRSVFRHNARQAVIGYCGSRTV